MTTVPLIYNLPGDSLPVSEMKQQLSIAYIQMVIAAAGCTAVSFATDYDGVDCGIKSSVEYGYKLGPQLDVQLKCTSQDVVGAEHVSWKIDKRTHHYVSSPKRSNPAVLAVLVVPADHCAWLNVDEERLLTESIMYWTPGCDLPALPDGQESITVKIPRENRFTRETLLGIMEEIGEGRPGWKLPTTP
ncbi:hypothetical protein NJB18091_37220 [Mycobacterium marinum]|uniref:DUF4365 domain-containing protein n=1 Tax=Mycobacterium marinum TaxID=1781 RepID=UPI0021C4549F|nr:DUF4365 domain-containing protein [Mycobacterium marinum]GJO02369.1 hypothetical protein NJB18091_37220 [Mycobacterium marinum]